MTHQRSILRLPKLNIFLQFHFLCHCLSLILQHVTASVLIKVTVITGMMKCTGLASHLSLFMQINEGTN